MGGRSPAQTRVGVAQADTDSTDWHGRGRRPSVHPYNPWSPPALAGAGALPDPATGLVHLGGGRFYDPSVGRPLQPDPAGGSPSVPQALNRYGVEVGGPAGVAEAVETDLFLRNWIQDNWYRQGSSAFIACATCILSEVKTTEQLFRLQVTLGSKSYKGQDLFRRLGPGKFQNIATGDVWTEEQFLWGGILESDELSIRWTGSRKVDNVLKKLLTKPGSRIAFNVGVAAILDIGFEGMEYATGTGRWGNPYWTREQKFVQARTAILGDLLIVGAVAAWNPSLWVAIPVYFGTSLAWSYVHPIIFPGQFEEKRNLRPLGQGGTL